MLSIGGAEAGNPRLLGGENLKGNNFRRHISSGKILPYQYQVRDGKKI
jgi:hypothetical protein